PFNAWTVIGCPSAPLGWTASMTSSRCIYVSAATPADDILPGNSGVFTLTATSAPGTENRTGTWTVVVSPTNSFANAANLKQATAMAPGLVTTDYSFQVLSAVVRSTP